MKMENSVSIGNPIKEVAALLSGESEPIKKDESPVEENSQVETPNENDESQPQAQSLEQEDNLETDDQSEEETDEENGIDTLNNLAEELDIPVEDMYAMNIKFADGEPATIGQLKDFYEANRDIETVKEQLEQKELDLQQEVSRAQETPQVSNDLLQARAQTMSIQDQYNRVDWETLRVQDPGNYAALQQDYRMQYDLALKNEQFADDAVKLHQQEYENIQADKLYQAMPELKDPKVLEDTVNSVRNYVSRYGFTDEDIGKIQDHRLMRLLIESSRLVGAKETAQGKKESINVPTANKPAAAKPVSNRKASLKRLTQKAQSTGDRRDITNAVSELLSQI